MEEYEYRGYTIIENSDGYFEVAHYEFPSMEEAMDWVDEQEDYVPEVHSPEMHKYIFFYVDKATDRCFEALIEADNYKNAEKILRAEYDVYSIADWYKVG